MNLNEMLIAEIEREANSTRKLLKQVPNEQLDWRPHEKSFPLSRLASHVAELPHFTTLAITTNEFDMIATPLPRNVCKTNEELVALFEAKIGDAVAALKTATNEQLMEKWTFRAGERVISASSRYDTIRSWMINHQIHHRGQLSVYLRLLDVPMPGMYGPSADDRIAMEKAQAASN
jgi:uncharacterized damage-inducible protein DinB